LNNNVHPVNNNVHPVKSTLSGGWKLSNKTAKRSWLSLVCLLLAALAIPLQAEDTFSADTLTAINAQLEAAQEAALLAKNDPLRLNDLLGQAVTLGQQAQTCITQFEQQQTQAQQAIDSLGTATPEEDTDVKNKRKQLGNNKQQAEKTLSQCRLISLQANTLRDDIRETQQAILKEQLFAQTPSILEYLQIALLEPGRWKAELTTIANLLANPPFNWQNLMTALAYGLAGLITGFVWSFYKGRQYRIHAPLLNDTSPTLGVVWRSLLRIAPYSLGAGLACLSLYFYPAGIPETLTFGLTLLVFSLSYAVLRSLLLRTPANVEGIVPVEPRTARKIYFWAQILLVATLSGVLFHSPLLDIATGNGLQSNSLTGLARITCGSLIGFALARLTWLISAHFLILKQVRIHLLASLALLVAIGSLWAGYRNFATFLFTGVFGSLFLLLLAWLLLRIPTEIFDGMDEGRAPWQQRIRQQLGLKGGQIVPGLLWLRLTHTVSIFALFSLLLLRLWGMSEQSMELLLDRVSNGFEIGGFSLEPLRIVSGLLVISLLVSLTHVFKKHLTETWLRRTTLSRGAREATTTVSGYAGVLLAVFMGLSVAGIEFKSLAIIAGALSVGIGFGLQNIVNNFVSGLILLFERPIRRGDWIKVGDAEGYVRDISIRSTTIQTFDRSDIIVPNSEIISGQVTNMMLNDNYGRLIIPIGVSYDADTERVIQVLQDAADAHPAIIKDRPDLKIRVFFRSFGENSLNFELRCFIRDIEAKLTVTSDLNLAINKAFRQQGIEMPFPQRTIHLVQEEPSHPGKSAEVPAKPADLG
jgi:small-conductance mechanosensitive channel